MEELFPARVSQSNLRVELAATRAELAAAKEEN
jgi:hypothetical protein